MGPFISGLIIGACLNHMCHNVVAIVKLRKLVGLSS